MEGDTGVYGYCIFFHAVFHQSLLIRFFTVSVDGIW